MLYVGLKLVKSGGGKGNTIRIVHRGHRPNDVTRGFVRETKVRQKVREESTRRSYL